MLLWAFLPIIGVFQSSLLFQVPFLISLFLWIGTGFSLLKTETRNKCILYYLPFLFIVYLYIIIGYGNLNIPTSFNYILLFAIVINSILYIEKPNKTFDNKLMLLSLVLIAITGVTTFNELLTNPYASRTLTSSSSDEAVVQLLKLHNVGSFSFIYGLVITLPTFYFLLQSVKNKIYKILLIGLILLSVVCVLISSFTTALILLYLDILFIIILRANIHHRGTFLAIMLVGFVITPIALTYFLDVFLNYSDSSIYTQSKLEGIIGVLSSGEMDSDLTPRTVLLSKSIDSFFTSPLFGVGAYYGTSVATPIGQHSQIVDEFGRYGLFGAIPFLLFAGYGLNYIFKVIRTKFIFNNQAAAPVSVYVFLAILNPVLGPGLLCSIYIVVPLLIRISNREHENIIYNRRKA